MTTQPSPNITERYIEDIPRYARLNACWDCRANPRAVIKTPWGEEYLSVKCSACARTSEVLHRLLPPEDVK